MSGILNVLISSGGAAAGSSLYDGFAATHSWCPTTAMTSTTAANVRSGHWARTDITKLKILCPNYYGSSELAPGATMGITASIEYPADTLTQITFGGSASGTIPDGGTLISDYLTIAIPNADRFWTRVHLTCSAGVVEVSGAIIDTDYANGHGLYMGDAFEISTTDRTMSGTISPDESAGYYPAILAPMTAPSVLILGDSIDEGVTDLTDFEGDLGAIARTVGPKFGYFNVAVTGATATEFLAHHTQRLLLSYCTHIFVGFGTNDIFAGDSKATIEGHLTSIYALCSSKVVFGRTIVPRTTSTDSWATTTNQTVVAGEAVRAALNADLRSSFGPPGGVSDIGAQVESSTKWIANKTNDGIHPNYSGYIDIAASGAINTALIGTPATPAVETGSGWGDMGTHLTITTRRRSNDTAYPNTVGNPRSTVRTATGNSSGKKYIELEMISGQSPAAILGLMTNATPNGSGMDELMGIVPDSFGLPSGGSYAFVSGTIFTPTNTNSFVFNPGDIYAMAVDFTNKYAYLRRNGVWYNSGDPTSGATGTGKIVVWTGTPTLYFGASLFGLNTPVRLRTNSFLFTPPSGYSAWG